MQAKYTPFPKHEQGPGADRNIQGREEYIPSLAAVGAQCNRGAPRVQTRARRSAEPRRRAGRAILARIPRQFRTMAVVRRGFAMRDMAEPNAKVVLTKSHERPDLAIPPYG